MTVKHRRTRRPAWLSIAARAVGGTLALAVVLTGAAPTAEGRTTTSQALALQLNATYDVSATLSHAAGTISVMSTATVSNGTAEPVSELYFNVVPARIGEFVLGEVRIGEEAATATVDDQTITVVLPAPLEVGQAVAVTIAYSATFATWTAGNDKNWLLAKLKGTLTAYRWIPWLSRPIPYDRPNGGEPFVTAVSPEVRVRLTSERKLIYATSGRRTSISKDTLTQTFVARDVRDFNFAAHPSYYKLTGWHGKTKVVVFYRSLPASKMLKWAIRSLDFYTQRIGPYAYPALMVAETGGGNGMESPGLIWVPRTTYSSSVPYMVAHEVAHQWFYAMIGSDAAEQPFADEAMADFLSRTLLASFRASNCTTKPLDGTIWDYTSACYLEVIYIQGSRYINAYRKRVGDIAFWQGVRNYFNAYRFGMGGIREFWDALDAAAGLASVHATRFPRYYE